MAIATAYTAINMNNWTFFTTASYPVHNSTHIQELGSGGAVVDYYGFGFTFSAGGDVTGGTLQTVNQSAGPIGYNVTGLNHNAVTVDNLIESGNESQLFAFLFSGNDTFNGSNFADTLRGNGGNDTMNGKGGIDKVYGDAGNDILVWGAGDTLNGGAGIDTLKMSGTVNLGNDTTNPNTRLVNFEQIDLRTGNNSLTLKSTDVLAMSPTDQVKILGDANDTVTIAGMQVSGGDAPLGYTRYTIGAATLIIDSDIHVI